MPAGNTQSIPQEQFLNMAGNLLHLAFLDSTRAKAKGIFRDLQQGKIVPLTTVEMEDKSTVRFDISLDHSEYLGTVNFGSFRSSVAVLIANLVENLKKEQQIKVFSEQNNPNAMVFGVTAVTQEANEPNVMVLGADMAADNPSVLLKLMYINHEQFTAEQDTA